VVDFFIPTPSTYARVRATSWNSVSLHADSNDLVSWKWLGALDAPKMHAERRTCVHRRLRPITTN
jgi:hypothetical protein